MEFLKASSENKENDKGWKVFPLCASCLVGDKDISLCALRAFVGNKTISLCALRAFVEIRIFLFVLFVPLWEIRIFFFVYFVPFWDSSDNFLKSVEFIIFGDAKN